MYLIYKEVPVSCSSTDTIGEIDLILEYNGTAYCTEVKLAWNPESLLRMVAEIVTYYSLVGDNPAFIKKYGIGCKRAIMFTKGSEQYFQWFGVKDDKPYKHKACDELKSLINDNDIAVFCIEDITDGYVITKLN